ncbi:MAG: hypothetical protein PHV36_09860 [Elusimicrobiales bacterium]|nr:hypothetical protein [Elusimicrobiales bacterium]
MKYWAYVNNEILGPFEKGKLQELPSFSPSLLVCPQTPVGEKTEDWKEASTYPELSALIGQGSMAHTASAPESFAPAPSAQAAPADAPEPIAKPAAETSSLSFKPLTASKSLDPVPPAEHAPVTMNIASNRLGKAGGAPAPAPAPAPEPQQSPNSFDPISLSRIERRSETLSGQNSPPPAEGIALEPQRAFSQPAEQAPAAMPAPEPAPISYAPTFEQAPEPAPAPVIETFSRSAASAPSAAAGAVTNIAGLESLVQKLDALSKAAATRQDLSSAIDPLRMKLDQMGEVISSIKNSQFQREVMDKLVYLENAVGELKTAFRNPQPAPAPAAAMGQKMEMEKNSDTVFGVHPPKQAEKPKSEPAKEPAKTLEIADTGSKPSKIVPALKKIFRLIITLVLLAAVALGAVIGLKNFGVFDATKFIPFPLPFVSAPAAPQAQGEQPGQPAQTPEQALAVIQAQVQPGQPGVDNMAPTTPEQQEELRKAMQAKALQEQAPKKPMPPDITPQIIYIGRTFNLKKGGPTLENKIYELAAKEGGNFSRTGWEVRPAEGGMYELAAVIPAKTGNLTYTFLVDQAKKAVSPSNEAGKAAFEAMAKESEAKTPKKSGKQKGSARQSAKPLAPPKKAAPAKKAPAEDEYEEYEVVDDGSAE